jgi:hypothetical protein
LENILELFDIKKAYSLHIFLEHWFDNSENYSTHLTKIFNFIKQFWPNFYFKLFYKNLTKPQRNLQTFLICEKHSFYIFLLVFKETILIHNLGGLGWCWVCVIQRVFGTCSQITNFFNILSDLTRQPKK